MAWWLAAYLLGATLTLALIIWAVSLDGNRMHRIRLIAGVALWP